MLARALKTIRWLLVALALIAALAAALLWRTRLPTSAGRDSSAAELVDDGARAELAEEALATEQVGAQSASGATAREPFEATTADRAHFRRILRGRVVDPEGEPVAAARVRCARIGASFPGKGAWGELAALQASGRTRSPILETSTHADGSFAFVDAPGGLVLIEVEAPGFQRAHAPRLVATKARDTDAGTLALSSGFRFAGQVVDELGRPLEGARVSRTSDSDWTRGFFTDYAYLHVARTDARGAFDVSSMPPPPWNIQVEHEDCIGSMLTVERAPATDEPLRIELRRGLELSGRVLAADEVALDELVVHAVLEPQHFERLGIPAETSLSGACDAQGRFRIARIPPQLAGEELRLGIGNARRWPEQLAAPVSARPGATDVRLELAPPLWLEFGARDASTREPLTDFEALREFHSPGGGMPMGGQRMSVSRGDALGRFRIRLPTQPLFDGLAHVQRVHIRPSLHAWYWTPPIPVEAGRRIDLGWIDFPTAETRLVHVRDALSGAPIAGARVTLADESALEHEPFAMPDYAKLAQGGHYSERHAVRTTAADGSARVVLRSDGAYLMVAHPAYRRSEAIEAHALRESAEIVVELHPGATVALRVASSKRPVAELSVLHTCSHESVADRMALHSGSGMDEALLTNDEGIAIFERLTPGTHRFRVDEARGTPLVLQVEEDSFHEAVFEID